MKRSLIPLFLSAAGLILITGCGQVETESGQQAVWTAEQAHTWYAEQDWIVGCNYTPYNAINQIEFWQEATFDPETIDRELGWAEEIGFNSLRVYLHYLVWARNPTALKERMEYFLEICESHWIRPMFVLFDDCWNENPDLGKQPDPIPGTHNSGWVQCPGSASHLQDTSLYPVLKAYTQDIIRHFADDRRVLLWDLYNEPGNNDYVNLTLPLLERVFAWAQEVRPSQPLSVGIWGFGDEFDDLNKLQAENSDVITFHHYGRQEELIRLLARLKEHDKPLICTEYMARTRDCTFESHMPVFKKENIGCYNWGFVSGKTNTIYMWDSVYAAEPELWFHDIFRQDGIPYSQEEIDLITSLTLNE